MRRALPQPASAPATAIASHRKPGIIAALRLSSHGRDDELGAFFRPRGPPRRYRLGLGVEAHRVGPVLGEVAEAGALPAAERVIGERNGNGEIDADHADVDARGEIACRVAVAR